MRFAKLRSTPAVILGVAATAVAFALVTPVARADDFRPAKVALVRTPDSGIQPQSLVDAKGVVHLIYFRGEPGNGNIFYVHSENSGKQFSRPLQVNSEPGSAIAAGNIRGAHLAVGKNGRVHVAWMGAGKAKAADQPTPMLYARLNDQATAFEPQRNLIQAAVGLDGGGSVCADDSGNVCVAWHAPEPGARGEENRRVWVTRSSDEGKKFAREEPASDKATGVCGCCGMRAFSDRKGNLFMLYRSATQQVNRDTFLITSKDQGKTFESNRMQPWAVNVCPMSSFAFAEGNDGVLAAWETDGQVSFTRIDPKTGKWTEPVAAPGAGKGRKHPAVAGNDRGETMLVWTEGMGWNRGGSVAWQMFDKNGVPTGERGRTTGVPTWSLVTVLTRPDGSFAIIY